MYRFPHHVGGSRAVLSCFPHGPSNADFWSVTNWDSKWSRFPCGLRNAASHAACATPIPVRPLRRRFPRD